MKNFLSFPLVTLGALFLAHTGFAQLPRVETAPLTLLANFNVTGVSSNRPTSPAPTPGDNPGNPVERITTEIGVPAIYSEDNGNQAFFVKHFQRKILETYAETIRLNENKMAAIDRVQTTDGPASMQTEIDELTDDVSFYQEWLAIYQSFSRRSWLREELLTREISWRQKQIDTLQSILDTNATNPTSTDWDAMKEALSNNITTLTEHIEYAKDRFSDQWEITAVRAPQASVEGACSTPYKVFITAIDGVNVGRPALTFDTGFTIQPRQTAGNTSETLSEGGVSKASGSVTTCFRFVFTSFYTNDPLSDLVDGKTSLAGLVGGEDYNTAGEYWRVEALGYMTYSLRSTPGPIAAVTQTKMNITGNGWWYHQTFDATNIFVPYAGIAPTRIKMGATKYQSGTLFPTVTGD